MTKEEKIIEAYGIDYDNFKDVIDEQGWNQKRIFNYQDLDYENFDYKETGHGIYISRPKSLQGIENNNGWIKVEDKLPEIGDKIISRRDLIEKVIEDIETVTRDFLVWYDMNNITHWKYYESKQPVY